MTTGQRTHGHTSIEITMSFLRPMRAGMGIITCEGKVTKPGSNIIVADGRGYAISDGPAKLIASMTGTMMVVRGREDIAG